MTRALRFVAFPAAVALGLFAERAALERRPLAEAASGVEIGLAVGDSAVESWRGRGAPRAGSVRC